MATVTSRDGTRIAYDKLGRGPLLVVITGATCFRNFKPIVKDAKVLAQSFTVISYDRRGRGDSSHTAPWAPEREVEDLEALIDENGGKATVYGHSSGAVLAMEAGLRLPGKIDRVAVYDAAYVDEDERESYGKLCRLVTALLDQSRHAQALKAFLTGIGMPRPFIWLLPLMPDWKPMVRLAPTLAYDMALTRHTAPVDRLAALRMPVLIGVGQKSPPSMHRVAGQLRAALPQARYEMLAGQDHMVSAKRWLPWLRDFVEQR